MTIQLHGLKTTGLVPIGGVVATIPALAGAYSCAATTEADDLGYVKCNGQVINDPTSPLNGLTIPNINNDVFLKGHTTSNSAGGSNTHDHTVPGHYHYWGGHWSTDDSRSYTSDNGDGARNQYQDGYGNYGVTYGDGNHSHGIRTEWGTTGVNNSTPGQYNQVTNNTSYGYNWSNTPISSNGYHSHGIQHHRHWIKARTTHYPATSAIDGRNTMTSGSSSTQPKYITVLYVMRIK